MAAGFVSSTFIQEASAQSDIHYEWESPQTAKKITE